MFFRLRPHFGRSVFIVSIVSLDVCCTAFLQTNACHHILNYEEVVCSNKDLVIICYKSKHMPARQLEHRNDCKCITSRGNRGGHRGNLIFLRISRSAISRRSCLNLSVLDSRGQLRASPSNKMRVTFLQRGQQGLARNTKRERRITIIISWHINNDKKSNCF